MYHSQMDHIHRLFSQFWLVIAEKAHVQPLTVTTVQSQLLSQLKAAISNVVSDTRELSWLVTLHFLCLTVFENHQLTCSPYQFEIHSQKKKVSVLYFSSGMSH